MNKIMALLALTVLILFAATPRAAENGTKKDVAESAESWSVVPAGAKPSYMGIHGGTMPVSLLVSGDGASLLSFVGRTGNDFMETLRSAHLPLPSFGNGTKTLPTHARGASLFAGNATASMPVVPISGFSPGQAGSADNLVPFGLSREPLLIEGAVTRPDHFPHARTIRPFRLPDYFQPRSKRSAK